MILNFGEDVRQLELLGEERGPLLWETAARFLG